MEPTLVAGDVVLLDPRAYERSAPAIGEVAVLEHPTQPGLRIVKRIHEIDDQLRCYVRSDNSSIDTTDSSSFGWVERDHLVGKVTSVIQR